MSRSNSLREDVALDGAVSVAEVDALLDAERGAVLHNPAQLLELRAIEADDGVAAVFGEELDQVTLVAWLADKRGAGDGRVFIYRYVRRELVGDRHALGKLEGRKLLAERARVLHRDQDARAFVLAAVGDGDDAGDVGIADVGELERVDFFAGESADDLPGVLVERFVVELEGRVSGILPSRN